MKELTSKSQFENAISSGVVVIEFGATWCHFCDELKVILADVEKQIPEASYYQLDIDKVPGIKENYTSELGVPLLLIFKDGEVKYNKLGLQFAKDLIPIINNIVAIDNYQDANDNFKKAISSYKRADQIRKLTWLGFGLVFAIVAIKELK